jgi:hypothetical protein
MYNIDWSVYYASETFADRRDLNIDDVIAEYERELWGD